MNRRSRTLWGGGPVSALRIFGMHVFGEARVGARPWFHIKGLLCKGEARRRGVARRAGFGTRLPFRNPRPAFAPPPPEPGAGSSRAVGWGKARECHGTVRGPGWGKSRWV